MENGTGPVGRVDLQSAACHGESSEIFFSSGLEDEAKMVCRQCAVRWECLVYALETRQKNGVWGGLTPTERSLLLRKLATSPAR